MTINSLSCNLLIRSNIDFLKNFSLEINYAKKIQKKECRKRNKESAN